MTKIFLSLSFIVFFVWHSGAQKINEVLLQKQWEASWISSPDAEPHEFSIQYFRKTFSISKRPGNFIVHVSADNRYKLFVNGQLVSLGPARGELYHWNYETVDIAPYLTNGDNIITAIIWYYADKAPEAQISFRSAFILQGDGEQESVLNTNNTWLSYKDDCYSPLKPELIYSYYVAGPGEVIDYRKFPSGWKNLSYEAKVWKPAQPIFKGLPKGVLGWSDGWMLVPSKLPQMELTKQRFSKVAEKVGLDIPAGFPSSATKLTIGPRQKVSFLLDQGELTNAYPVLDFSKGKDASITIGYAEALYIDEGSQKDWRAQNKKGHRNETINKRFVGVKDRIISGGLNNQSFSSLAYRTFRFVQVSIETSEEPLVIEDFYSIFTGYPFKLNAAFESGSDTLDKIFSTGWHTARLCAVETYMDCPYYEQLQYIGDTRIQALVSLFNSGDDKLMRNAITQLDQSRMAEGITLSRYPSRNPQQIPPFSLWWISMLHDYWMYRPDSAFVRDHLQGMRQVLWFFDKYQEDDGSLYNVPYWNFTDWCESPGWNGGVAPIGRNGHSAALDLQLLWAFQLAAELEGKLGISANSIEYDKAAKKLQATIRKKYWYDSRHLFADTEEKSSFSQHVNALAILTNTATPKETVAIADYLLKDQTISPATIYFKYYLHLALKKAGHGNQYLDWLDTWKENLRMGMTTWAEISDINETRSDCHAWGSSPNIEFFRTVLGIDSDAPGFKKIRIEPMPGKMQTLKGQMPHPNGMVTVSYKIKGQIMDAIINLPPETNGKFIWLNREYPLQAGKNTISTSASIQAQPNTLSSPGGKIRKK